MNMGYLQISDCFDKLTVSIKKARTKTVHRLQQTIFVCII